MRLKNSIVGLITIIWLGVMGSFSGWLNHEAHAQPPTPTLVLEPQPTQELPFPFPDYVLPTPFPDDIPPVTMPLINGLPLQPQWYTNAITLTFETTDVGGRGRAYTWYAFNDEIEWRRYDWYYPPIPITYEGVITLYFLSQDKNNNYESLQTSPVLVDLTPPSLTLPAPQSYTRCVTIPYQTADSTAGIANIETAIDGKIRPIDLLDLPLGQHTLTLTVTDQAGWTTTASQPFTITATLPSLQCAIEQFGQRGQIDSVLVTSLLQTLTTTTPTVSGLNDLINQLHQAAHDQIDPAAINRLTKDIEAIIRDIQKITACSDCRARLTIELQSRRQIQPEFSWSMTSTEATTFTLAANLGRTFAYLPASTYIIAENPTTLPEGQWDILKISCQDSQTSAVKEIAWDGISYEAKVELGASEQVKCVFVNNKAKLTYLPLIVK